MDRHSATGLKLIKSSHYIEDSVVTNEPDIGPKLDKDFLASVESWRASQPAAAAVTAPSFSGVLLILKDRLAVSRRRLAKADRVHVANVRYLWEVRPVAQKDRDAVYSKMGATRRTFEEHFPGSENAFVLGGFQTPTSQDSTQLLEQADTVLERLKSEDFVLPDPLTKAVKVDAKLLVGELEADVEQLRTSFEVLRLARREVQKSRKNKNRAVEEHGQLFVWTVRTIEGLYRLAGEEELAGLIRPSGRRPGRRAVEVAEEEAEQASAGQPASDPPASDEPAPDSPASGDGPASTPAPGSSDPDSPATDASS